MSSGAFPLFQNRAGDNQFGAYGTGLPGVVPSAGGGGQPDLSVKQATSGGVYNQGDFASLAPIAPNLTTDFFNFLKGNVGTGATPFNLQTGLPSQNGALTNPGQLSAPLTPILQQLNEFYQGKNVALPGMDTLSEISRTGLPIDQTPAWQAMIAAQQKNIGMNEAALRETFASLGSLKGSPFGGALSGYREQTTKDQNAALLAAITGAGENAANRRLSAGSMLTEGAFNVGQLLQGLDQQSIDRLVQEFIRTRPEYSPYLNLLYGAATTFPPYTGKPTGGGVLGGLAGAAGTALGSFAGPIGAAAGTAIGKKIGT